MPAAGRTCGSRALPWATPEGRDDPHRLLLEAEPKLQVACQLSAKAVQQSLRVLILAPDESTARAIDKLLWTFPATGFLPHCMVHDRLAPETPILIARDCEVLPHDQVLLNLAPDSPSRSPVSSG